MITSVSSGNDAFPRLLGAVFGEAEDELVVLGVAEALAHDALEEFAVTEELVEEGFVDGVLRAGLFELAALLVEPFLGYGVFIVAAPEPVPEERRERGEDTEQGEEDDAVEGGGCHKARGGIR